MQSVKALDELTPADLWLEVTSVEDEFWQDAQERQRRVLKVLLEGALEEELTLLLGAGRYRRTDDRSGYRNGFYSRDLATQIGIVTAIRVPRARGVSLKRAAFSRYQRRQAQVNQVICEVFLAGVSTRRVGETLAALLGEPVSALLLDGVYLRMKTAKGSTNGWFFAPMASIRLWRVNTPMASISEVSGGCWTSGSPHRKAPPTGSLPQAAGGARPQGVLAEACSDRRLRRVARGAGCGLSLRGQTALLGAQTEERG